MLIKASPCKKFEIIREMLIRDDNLLNIRWLCDIAGVSRSGYYRWVSAENKRMARDEQDRHGFELIIEAYRFRGYDKGVRGIYMRLLHSDPPVVMNLKKIRRIMRKFNLVCPIRKANPYRRMAKALKTSNCAPNLLNREFRCHGPRMILLTDITYIGRTDDRFTYLCVIMDAHTKQILGFALSETLEVDFVLESVQMLIANHGAEITPDTMIHSDQGVHYTSHKFIELVTRKQLRRSMSRRANCWDNAPQESFFGHMKDEVTIRKTDRHIDISAKVSDWINYYNNDRYQWGLAKLSPNEYYRYLITKVYPLSFSPHP